MGHCSFESLVRDSPSPVYCQYPASSIRLFLFFVNCLVQTLKWPFPTDAIFNPSDSVLSAIWLAVNWPLPFPLYHVIWLLSCPAFFPRCSWRPVVILQVDVVLITDTMARSNFTSRSKGYNYKYQDCEKIIELLTQYKQSVKECIYCCVFYSKICCYQTV